MPMLDLRHLRTMAALRDTGSLVEAADRVFLTQSALSHQIKDLEGRLGCSLFIRKTRPVRFTAAGRRLLKLADEVLPLIHKAERDLERLGGGESGRLFMAIECHSCFEWLLPAINRYRESWPDVELDISAGFNFAPLPALARGDLDLVITSDPVEGLGISYHPLFRYEAQLALSLSHALNKKEFIEPSELSQETVITYPVDKERLDLFTRFLEPAGVEPKRIRTADLTAMMIQLVASGRGLACLPNWALHEYLQKNYVTARSLGKQGIWPNLYAAVRSDESTVAYLEAFIETAISTSFEVLHGILPVVEQ